MTSVIKSLSLKNFKGFSDEVRIELRPITLLFGANSAGKSSVLHALQYVREILDRNNTNADLTAQGGEAIDLGGFMNLVHGRSADRQIEIEVEMALGDSSIPELVPDASDDWQTSEAGAWSFYNALHEIRNRVQRVSVRLSIGWNSLREEPVVVGYEIGTNGEWCVKLAASGDGRDTRMKLNRENSIFVADEQLARCNSETEVDLSGELQTKQRRPRLEEEQEDDDYEELENGDEDEDDETGWEARLDDWISLLDLTAKDEVGGAGTGLRLNDSGSGADRSALLDLLFAAQEAGVERPGEGLRAWLSGFNGAMPQLGKLLQIQAPAATGAYDAYIAREFTAFLSWLTIAPAMLLRDELRRLRYLGPLRRIPPRGFEVSLTKSEAAWSDGMAAWETLMTGPQSLVDVCSEWMSAADRLGTGYSLARKQLQEFDLSTPEPNAVGRPRPRIALTDSAGLTHQAQDVGVGISQVLPVVVAAQDATASVVCIEQPELHIHPAVQVGLGDLFIDGAVNKGLSFLIETHSEHLVMRLQRRLREQAAGELPEGVAKVTPDDVSFIYLGRDDQCTVTASQIGLAPDGKFDSPWPNGFFSERAAEVLPAAMRSKLEAARRGKPP